MWYADNSNNSWCHNCDITIVDTLKISQSVTDQREVGTRFASLIFANMRLANLVPTSRWYCTEPSKCESRDFFLPICISKNSLDVDFFCGSFHEGDFRTHRPPTNKNHITMCSTSLRKFKRCDENGASDQLEQDCGNSSALAVELPQSCAKP